MDGRPSMPHLFSLLAAFVAIAVGMGLLSAGVLMPAVGATGMVAKSTVQAFEELPEDFTAAPLSQRSRILDAAGNTIATPYDENRIIVPLDEIAPIMQMAQIAIEDSRFYEHGGLDLRGTMRALVHNLTSPTTQGGSSLTQQYVKLTLKERALRNGNKEAAKAAVASEGLKGITRKLQELKYALNVEETLTKDQILESYLNLVYYGDQAYGIEAASLHYFNVHASELNLAQAATLAGLVQAPSATNPVDYPEKAQARRDVVINRMVELGVVTREHARKATSKDVVDMLDLTSSSGGSCVRSPEPYFCTYVLAYLKKMPQLGDNIDERTQAINSGGLTIKTTLNTDLTEKVRKQLTKKVPTGDKSGVGAAATIVEPGTGDIVAMAQTSEYTVEGKKSTTAKTAVNWNVGVAYGGTDGQAFGSTAKMFALVAALEEGIPVNGKVEAKFATTEEPAWFYPADYEKCTFQDPYDVRNDMAIGGQPIELRQAIALSVNTAFVGLVLNLGCEKIQHTMTKMGLTLGNGSQVGLAPGGLALGTYPVTPVDLASAYATLAAGGKYCAPNPIEWIKTSDGKKLDIPDKQCKQVVDKEVARGVTTLLQGVIKEGTGTGAQLAGNRPAAGKTGTHEGYTESWFVGYTPQLATAVWVGTPVTQEKMKKITIGGQYYQRVFGSTIAAPLWKRIMDTALKGMKEKKFPDPSAEILYGDKIPVSDVIGKSVAEATKILEDRGLKAQVGGQVYSNVPAGLVAATAPSGIALKGTTVQLYVSNGPAPVFTPPPPSTQPPPPRDDDDDDDEKPDRPTPSSTSEPEKTTPDKPKDETPTPKETSTPKDTSTTKKNDDGRSASTPPDE